MSYSCYEVISFSLWLHWIVTCCSHIIRLTILWFVKFQVAVLLIKISMRSLKCCLVPQVTPKCPRWYHYQNTHKPTGLFLLFIPVTMATSSRWIRSMYLPRWILMVCTILNHTSPILHCWTSLLPQCKTPHIRRLAPGLSLDYSLQQCMLKNLGLHWELKYGRNMEDGVRERCKYCNNRDDEVSEMMYTYSGYVNMLSETNVSLFVVFAFSFCWFLFQFELP